MRSNSPGLQPWDGAWKAPSLTTATVSQLCSWVLHAGAAPLHGCSQQPPPPACRVQCIPVGFTAVTAWGLRAAAPVPSPSTESTHRTARTQTSSSHLQEQGSYVACFIFCHPDLAKRNSLPEAMAALRELEAYALHQRNRSFQGTALGIILQCARHCTSSPQILPAGGSHTHPKPGCRTALKQQNCSDGHSSLPPNPSGQHPLWECLQTTCPCAGAPHPLQAACYKGSILAKCSYYPAAPPGL